MIKVIIYSDDELQYELLAAMLPPFSDLDAPTSLENEVDQLPGFDIAFIDLCLPTWPKIIRRVRQVRRAPAIIALCEESAVETIVEAMRIGAGDWLPKPFTVSRVARVVSDALNRRLPLSSSAEHPAFTEFLGASDQIREIKRRVRSYATSEEPVLITGESGTGKGLIARALHKLSRRSSGPFCARNCGAIAPTLIEADLFGTRKGSYTGAVDRPGCIELSHGGTLFLDEIGDLPTDNQVKILTVLEEHRFLPLGATKTEEADSRFIAATNRDLKEMVAAGTFREDLYYRLNILPIHIPPLRERKEDLPLLTAHFLAQFGKELEDKAMGRVLDYHWPGNIRELRNVLVRSSLTSDNRLIRADELQF